MKKVIASTFIVSVLMFAALPAFAQTAPTDPNDQTTILIQIAQEILSMITQINQNIATDEASISNLQTRMAAIETKQVSAPLVGAVDNSQADQDAVAALIHSLPDTVKKACTQAVGVQRRTYDRIFNLMCTENNL